MDKDETKNEEHSWPLPLETIKDITHLRRITFACQMHTASIEFEERNDVLRIKRVSLVGWDHEYKTPDTRKIIVHCGNH